MNKTTKPLARGEEGVPRCLLESPIPVIPACFQRESIDKEARAFEDHPLLNLAFSIFSIYQFIGEI